MRGIKADDKTMLEKLKSVLSNIRQTAFENEQHQSESEERKKLTTNSFVARGQGNITCFICAHMKEVHDTDPPAGNHVYYQQAQTGLTKAKPESCSFIAPLSIKEKREFMISQSLCPICLNNHSSHSRDTCTFAINHRSFKCRSPSCPDRFTMCTLHVNLNIEPLTKTKRIFQENNCEFNW